MYLNSISNELLLEKITRKRQILVWRKVYCNSSYPKHFYPTSLNGFIYQFIIKIFDREANMLGKHRGIAVWAFFGGFCGVFFNKAGKP